MSAFHLRASGKAKDGFLYPSCLARLPWQLFITRLKKAKTDWAMTRVSDNFEKSK